jgi:hypothetical protein
MNKGPVKIAEYDDEILAVNVQHFLADSGIEAMVFTGGIILSIPRYEVHVPAEKAQEAKALLVEFEAEGPAGDHDDMDLEGPADGQEPTDREGEVE